MIMENRTPQVRSKAYLMEHCALCMASLAAFVHAAQMAALFGREIDRMKAAEQEADQEWIATTEEACRRQCDPDDLLAIWDDTAEEPADYDDHDSEADQPCRQSILDETGMRQIGWRSLSRTNPPPSGDNYL